MLYLRVFLSSIIWHLYPLCNNFPFFAHSTLGAGTPEMTQSNRMGEPSTSFIMLDGVFKNRGGSPDAKVFPRSELCFPEVMEDSSATGESREAPNPLFSGAKCVAVDARLGLYGLNISLSVNSASDIPDTKSSSASVLENKLLI